MDQQLPPYWLVDVIRSAEENWQQDLNPLRRFGEVSQEHLARRDPALVAAQDFSVGTCNIRPSSARRAVAWAFAQGLAPELGFETPPDVPTLVTWIMDPEQETQVVRAILARLRWLHPGLKALSWQAIGEDDHLVAKLYSGFMGAGGAWERWGSSLVPGTEALRRLGCREGDSSCRLVQEHRPE